MIKTELCDLLGIKYPIFQGGMAWIADADLAAAVSNAGTIVVLLIAIFAILKSSVWKKSKKD